jgi:hypothetical protein
MAEFLVFAGDNSNSDAVKDLRGCYKYGDIVEIREDGAPRGRLECLPKFYWINCNKTNKNTVDKYQSSQKTSAEVITRRRLYRLQIENLNKDLLETLYKTGEINIEWKDLVKIIQNKNTGKNTGNNEG